MLKKTGRWCPKSAYFNSLFPPHHHVLSIRIMFHLICVTRRMIWFFGFSLYQWTGNSSKIENRYHPQLPYGLPVSWVLSTWSWPVNSDILEVLAGSTTCPLYFYVISISIWILSDPMERWKSWETFGGYNSRAYLVWSLYYPKYIFLHLSSV